MASTMQQQTPPQNPLKPKENTKGLNRTTSNGSLSCGQFKQTVDLRSKATESPNFINTGPTPPLITDRKTILRCATSSQDSIGGPLSSVGPIPACGLDDWKYRQQQLKQQQQGQKMGIYTEPSPSGSLNFLRLPLGQISLSGVGASCASLLVHAPSLSRVSGQTDEDFAPPLDEESISSSAVWLRKPIGYIDATQLGCPICYRRDYALTQTVSTGLLVRSRSLCALRLPEEMTHPEAEREEPGDGAVAVTSVTGVHRPAICLFHKTRGWTYHRQSGPDIALPVVWSSKSASSISIPNVHLSVFNLKGNACDELESLPTPTVKVEPEVNQDPSQTSLNTSKRKCQAWLQSWR
ncbi:hypothetical protein D915_000978 [Fasciola hepatica]|uniref:Uncharacterized protein n=1 Tax=Fasciola hepatica TaxID=6192 RepID=A0A4E0RMY0_FASHE|nr:hypothetical protein D915_000978 [Fasciola hepatica]